MTDISSQVQELSPKEIQKIFASIDIPPCPTIVIKTLEESVKKEPDLHKLVTLIMTDAGFSSAILKLANSALYSGGNKFPNVRKAAERLGMEITISTVLEIALRNTGDGNNSEWMDKFWEKQRKIAFASTKIARFQEFAPPDLIYTYGLFRDASIPLMMKKIPEYQKIVFEGIKNGKSRIQIEEENFPCTHPLVGGLLLKEWGLPALLGMAIRFQHDHNVYSWSSNSLPDSVRALIAIADLAEYLLAETDPSFESEVNQDVFEKAIQILHFDENTMAKIREKIQVMLES
ncbi:MAG TPA: HDOD domain-containing protein [Ignavibacteriaceae bacterium]